MDMIEDLYQEGMKGLITAYKNYKSDYNTKFSTYAYYYILGEVTNHIYNNKTIKYSKDMVKLYKGINTARERIAQVLGRYPSNSEIANYLDIDINKVEEALLINDDIKSLDYSSSNELNDLYNYIKINDKNIDINIIDLKSEISKLSDLDKELIIDRYFNDLTQSEISRKLGMSQVQVSREESKILKVKRKLSVS